MQQVLKLVRIAAPHTVSVLLQGETGTGKEVMAQTLHDLSPRANQPFVVQDCGLLSETLLESELFGHVKGSFTGATTDHSGIFQTADGGSVFLDEVENTTAALQAKLLRVIETGEIRPVGATQTRHVDVRVIVASNLDLAEQVKLGRFRADLFFRMSTFPLVLPPLRDRPEDIRPLVQRFVAEASRSFEKEADLPTKLAWQALVSYRWPGNVRELRNVIERAVLLVVSGQAIDLTALPEHLQSGILGAEPRAAATEGSLKQRVMAYEAMLIGAAIERHHGVLRRAARELGTDPTTLGRKAKRYGLLVDLV